MTISKALRFEIFARDGFTCQYCGSRPPDVVLELDHIQPRAKNGSDDPINLITSCFECNRGKRDKVIAEIPVRPDADLRYLKAQQEVVEAKRYLSAKKRRDKAHAKLCAAMQEVWRSYLTPEYAPSVRVMTPWINRYGPEEVERSITLATVAYNSGRFGGNEVQTVRNLMPYIGGILKKREQCRREEEIF